MAVVIETTLGDLVVDLFVQERPKTCLNFLKLCKLKYYNFNLFHNVEHGFIAQTGDPSGAGGGGESVWGVVEGSHKRYFEAESLPKIKHSVPGLVSMVSLGKNMVGSQFFFTLGSDLISLDGIHCVIGEVAEGHEVLRKMNEAIVDDKYRPYQDIRITHTTILEDPFDDPRGFQIPSRSPSPTPERLKNGRIAADEDIDDTEGKSAEEIHEMLQEREAKARATILEIVGDLPDADIAPPENVLFICKLNPVTNDDDLEIIFSRFGKVKSCEVIRDKVTGDSLQYAFVEFDDKKACENAFFKMDNVLIDDRRIHVDFSQSVAKVKWRGKGRGVVHEDGTTGKLDFNNLRASSKQQNNRGAPRTPPRGGRDQRDDRYERDYNRNRKEQYQHPERYRDDRRRDDNRYRINRGGYPRRGQRSDFRSREIDRRRDDGGSFDRQTRYRDDRDHHNPNRNRDIESNRKEPGKSRGKRDRSRSPKQKKEKKSKKRRSSSETSDSSLSSKEKNKKKKNKKKKKRKRKHSSSSSSSSE